MPFLYFIVRLAMNTSYDMVNYDAAQHMAHSQDKKSLRPIRNHIIQLICHLLQVVIVICQQLEMLYQSIRQSLQHIKQDITGNDVVFYHKSSIKNIRIKTPKFYQVKQGLPLAYQAFSLTLFFMIISSVALMFVKAGF